MSTSSSDHARDKIEEKVKAELGPVFLDFYRGSAKERIYARNAEWFARRILKSTEITLLMTNIPIVMQIVNEDLIKRMDAPNDESMGKLKASRRVLSCLNAFSYMAFVEALATPYIDLSILLLVPEGPCFHIGPDRKHNYIRHAMSFKDLDSPSVSLANKLDFLESCRLTFFSKWIDRDLRNTIAHLKFQIDDSGDFFKIEKEHDEEKRVKVSIIEKLQSFNKYHDAVSNMFASELKRTYPTDKTIAKE